MDEIENIPSDYGSDYEVPGTGSMHSLSTDIEMSPTEVVNPGVTWHDDHDDDLYRKELGDHVYAELDYTTMGPT